MLIPIYPELTRVFTWVLGLATHSGYYGTGEVGFARPDAYFPDIIRLLSYEPSVALIPIASTVVILLASLGQSTSRERFGMGKFGLDSERNSDSAIAIVFDRCQARQFSLPDPFVFEHRHKFGAVV